ncbi:MAG: hypothetical protein WCB18_04820 [Thermoplasmata archaeon]
MPSQLEVAVGIQAVLAVWIAVRSYGSYQGRMYSSTRVMFFPVLIVLLYLETEFETIATVPWAFPVWTVVDVVVLIASAVTTLPIAGRLVRVSRRDDGAWYYQYGIELIAFYLALWVVRLGLAAYFDPASVEFVAPTGALSATASVVVVLIQALFSVSSGLVVGRAIGTYRLYQTAQAPAPPLGTK